jgi:DNA topoisomerase-3
MAGLNINAPAFQPTHSQPPAGPGPGRGEGPVARPTTSTVTPSVATTGSTAPTAATSRAGRGRGGRGGGTGRDDNNGNTTNAGRESSRKESGKKPNQKKLNPNPEEGEKTSTNKGNPPKQKLSKKVAQDKTSSASTDKSTVPSIPPSQSQQTSDINYGRGQKITIFHVAEKPSIAQAIANGLSHGNTVNFRKKILPVHEFSGGTFPKAPYASTVSHRVSSVAGHVFETDFGAKYQSWESVDPLELFQAPIIRKPSKGSVVKHIQDEAKGCDFIVLWMDCDR